MKKLVTSLFILFSSAAFSQARFQKTMMIETKDLSYVDCKQTSDGGYIICGNTMDSLGNSEAVLVKTDANAQAQWTKFASGAQYSNMEALKTGEVLGGGYFLYTRYDNMPNLIRFDQNGVMMWSKTYTLTQGYSWSSSMRSLSDGGYMLYSTLFGGGQFHLFTRLDNNGNVMWSSKCSPTNDGGEKLEGFDVAANANLTAFTSVGNANDIGVYAASYDGTGNLLWSKKYLEPTNAFYVGVGVTATSDGGSALLCANGSDYNIIKLGTNGTFQWSKLYKCDGEYGGSNWQNSCIVQTSDGGFAFTAMTSGQSGFGPTLFRTSATGMIKWVKRYSLGNVNSIKVSLAQTLDKGFMISTASVDQTNKKLGWLIKTDSLGSSGCHETAVMYTDSMLIINTLSSGVAQNGATGCALPVNVSDNEVFEQEYCAGAITGISEKNLNTSLDIYPNPSAGKFTLKNSSEINSMDVFDVNGKKVFSSSKISDLKINVDLSGESKGIYMLNIFTDSGVIHKKVLIE
jgi:hypothetical protein